MKVNDYQQMSSVTAIYPGYAKTLYPLLGLVGELGELVAKFHTGMWPYGEPVPAGEEPYAEALTALIGVGQRCEVLKKQIRGGTDGLSDDQRQGIRDRVGKVLETTGKGLEGETGDVLWYISALITDMKGTLEDVLTENLRKLYARHRKGQIHSHKPDSQDHLEGGR
jgi:NTP pyrophosphatase (non-canonical NTP hydrolase)